MNRLHLLAHIAGRAIAVPAHAVESVVDVREIVAAPRSHPAVRGLSALRSRVVTVIDTWQILGLSSGPPDAARAMLTVVDGSYYAVLVDTLEDVAQLDVEPLPSGITLGGRWSAVATGAAQHNNEPLLVLDLSRLIGALATVD